LACLYTLLFASLLSVQHHFVFKVFIRMVRILQTCTICGILVFFSILFSSIEITTVSVIEVSQLCHINYTYSIPVWCTSMVCGVCVWSGTDNVVDLVVHMIIEWLL